MNKLPPDEIIIVNMSENITILVTSNQKKEQVKKIGFSEVNNFYMSYSIDGLSDKINKIRDLIRLGGLFCYGIGWSPSELISYYIAQGVTFNKYKIISWSDKSTYHITECDPE